MTNTCRIARAQIVLQFRSHRVTTYVSLHVLCRCGFQALLFFVVPSLPSIQNLAVSLFALFQFLRSTTSVTILSLLSHMQRSVSLKTTLLCTPSVLPGC